MDHEILFLVQIFFSAACLVLALFLYLDHRLGEREKLLDFSWDRWLLVASLIPPVYAASRLLASFLLKLSEWVLENRSPYVHYVLLGLVHPLTCVQSAVLARTVAKPFSIQYAHLYR